MNDFFSFTKVIKVKTKLKEFKHEWFRGFFFGRGDDKKVYFYLIYCLIYKYNNFQDEHHPAVVDGINCVATKEASDESWHCR